MTRVLIPAVILSTAAMGAAACSDNDNPTGPSDDTIVFRATLSSANEVPPITNAEAGAGGVANITFHPTRDGGGNITGGTFDFEVSLQNFPANTPLTAAHIHTGGAGSNGGIVVNTGLASGQVTLANGSGGFTRTDASPQSPDIARQIVDNPAGFYFNVHTQLNPGGAVRGQLVRIE